MVSYLSNFIDSNTPTYGGKSKFNSYKLSDIDKGDIANNTKIETNTHIGTHLDMPYHFYKDGKKISDYSPEFWIFKKVLFLEINPKSELIKTEIQEKLIDIKHNDYEALLIKTNSHEFRSKDRYFNANYGFDPSLANILRLKFPYLRLFGFDTISVSSFKNRKIGRKAHYEFLGPPKPILLLEDMDLRIINSRSQIKKIIVSPMLLKESDGIPATVFCFHD